MESFEETLNRQIGGNHYNSLKVQPAELISKCGLSFFEGNAVKYLARWKKKGGIEDLKKACHYIDMINAHREEKKAVCDEFLEQFESELEDRNDHTKLDTLAFDTMCDLLYHPNERTGDFLKMAIIAKEGSYK